LPNCKVDLGSGELVPSSQIENEFGEKMHEIELNGPTVTILKKAIKESITDRACLKLEVIAEEQNQYKEAGSVTNFL
jgi:hypothetical protein